jgi:hypothetical protein
LRFGFFDPSASTDGQKGQKGQEGTKGTTGMKGKEPERRRSGQQDKKMEPKPVQIAGAHRSARALAPFYFIAVCFS